jgi:N,N'-diacetyllegionaminate synthase
MQYRQERTAAQEARRQRKFERRREKAVSSTRTFVIAEIGSCHDGDLDKALRLIAAAHDAGVDAVKAQFWSSADQLADQRRVGDEYRAIYQRYQVPRDWLPLLQKAANERGIVFGCSTYLAGDVIQVADYVQLFKVSSFEALDDALWRVHEWFPQPLVVSVGMCTADELLRLRNQVTNARIKGRTVQLLHCVSAYPAPLEALNLRVIRAQNLDGFSDHSGREETGSWAVHASAKTIEVHLALEDTDQANPDAGPHALRPSQLKRYVQLIREAEATLGGVEKAQQPCEAAMANYRSIGVAV